MSELRTIGDRMLPRQQTNWDARAAVNFICGGAGGGLLLATALASVHGEDLRPLVVLALALVGTGLAAVWFEIGRPWRALNVYRNAATSWMTREAMIAPLLFASGAAAVWFNRPAAFWIAGGLGLTYVYCQARMLYANKGIPAWRHPSCVAMVVATGVVEGVGLLCAAAPYWRGVTSFGFVLAALLALRWLAWRTYRHSLRDAGSPVGTTKALNTIEGPLVWLGHALPAVLGVVAGFGGFTVLAAIAGVLAAAAGAWFKYMLVCRAAFTQGFALPRTPSRGSGKAGPGVEPGWNRGRSRESSGRPA